MSNDDVTEAVYEFIRVYVDEHGFAPSLREIADGVYMSPTNVVRYLDKLSARGRISRELNVPRSIVLLDEDEYG